MSSKISYEQFKSGCAVEPCECSVSEEMCCKEIFNAIKLAEEKFNSALRQPTNAGAPLLEPEPHLGPREPIRGDAFVEFVDE